MMTEAEQRAAVVAETMSWIGTPYHHEARVKGVGVDCAQILVGVFSAPGVGLMDAIEIDHYPFDWHMNRSAEQYMSRILEYVHEIPGPPLPGDIVLWQFGLCFSHAAIVTQWPRVVHAYLNCKVFEEDAEAAGYLRTVSEGHLHRGEPRPRKFFSYWGRQ